MLKRRRCACAGLLVLLFSLCSNGGCRRHRAIRGFDAVEFVVDVHRFAKHIHHTLTRSFTFASLSQGTWFPRRKSLARNYDQTVERTSHMRCCQWQVITKYWCTFDVISRWAKHEWVSQSYCNIITNYLYILNMSFNARFQRFTCGVKSTKSVSTDWVCHIT